MSCIFSQKPGTNFFRRCFYLAIISLCFFSCDADFETNSDAIEYSKWNKTQIVDDFNKPLIENPDEAIGYRYYSHLNGNRGTREGGLSEVPHGFDESVQGQIRLYALSRDYDISWTGIWYSLNGLDTEPDRNINLDAALPWPIRDTYQYRISNWEMIVKGSGLLTVQFIRVDGSIAYEWHKINVDQSKFGPIGRPIPQGLGEVKFLNIIVESETETNSSITFDQIKLLLDGPEPDPLEYGFLAAYAQLLRCYDPESGFTRDRAEWPTGDFDSVTATGFQALAASVAYHREMISFTDAIQIVEKSIKAIQTLSSDTKAGWLPHYSKHGQRHPDSEWSTLDTALSLISLLQAVLILDLDSSKEQVDNMFQSLDFSAVTTDDMQLSIGFDSNGDLYPIYYSAWGSEIALISIVRAYQDLTLSSLAYTRTPPAWAGRGYLYEMGALFIPHLGAPGYGNDQYGVDWFSARLVHFEVQKNYDTFFYFGRTPMEIVDADGRLAYLIGGIGDGVNPAIDSVDGFGGPWIAPYYLAMAASLNPYLAENFIQKMKILDLMPPLSGPAESVLLDKKTIIERYHTLQSALSASFSTIGYYHAIEKKEGAEDVIYQTLEKDDRLKQAVEKLFPPESGTISPGKN